MNLHRLIDSYEPKYKRFDMYIPLEMDGKPLPMAHITYDFVDGDDEWLVYRSEESGQLFNITEKCIDDFIKLGYIKVLE